MRLAALYRSGPCAGCSAWQRMADGRTALSQHRRRPQAKRPRRRRVGVFMVTAAAATVVVVAIALLVVAGRPGSVTDPLGAAVAQVSSGQAGPRAGEGTPEGHPPGCRNAVVQRHECPEDQQRSAARVKLGEQRRCRARAERSAAESVYRPGHRLQHAGLVRLQHKSVRLPERHLDAGRAAGGTTPRTPAAPTASRRRCRAPRWPAPGPTGRRTRPRRSSGASAISRAGTALRAMPGRPGRPGLVLGET